MNEWINGANTHITCTEMHEVRVKDQNDYFKLVSDCVCVCLSGFKPFEFVKMCICVCDKFMVFLGIFSSHNVF